MPALRMALDETSGEAPPRASAPARAPVWFDGRRRETAIHERSQLVPGRRYAGPAVVAEYSATTVVPPGMRFHLDQTGNLLIRCR
jgi:N-methylhydantoinase A